MMPKENDEDLWEEDPSVHTISHTNNAPSKAEDTYSYEIATHESRQVFKQKVLVVLVLFLAAVSVSLAVFYITSNAENEEFQQHFQGGAVKIVDSFESILQEKLGSIGSLCLSFTARGLAQQKHEQANSSGPAWPFVTMESFHESAASTRILSNVLHMSLLPVVTDENRKAWEAYSVQNGEWYSEGFAYQLALLENGFSLQGTISSEQGTRALLQDYKATTLATPFRERDPRRRLSNITHEAEVREEFTLFMPFVYEYAPDWSLAPATGAPLAPVW
jgi:hypothetical protein